MKRRYLSIIALAFVFGIATIFTSCKSDEEVQAEQEKLETELNDLFDDALNEVEAEMDSAVVEVNDSINAISEDVEAVVEEAEEEVK